MAISHECSQRCLKCASPFCLTGCVAVAINRHLSDTAPIYAATLALYLVAALSNSSLFSARSERKGCWGAAFCRALSGS